MSNFLFSPGPTHVPPNILKKFSRPPLHHRSDEFRYIHLKCTANLKKLFKTAGEVAILSATGTGAMEAAVCNFVDRNDKAIVIETGKFGKRWSELAGCFGVEVTPVKVTPGDNLKLDEFKKVLKKHPDVNAVFMTGVESSTGALYDIEPFAQAVKEMTDAVVIADVISALGAEEFSQDEWGVDVAIGSSQKALMCPPGLSFVSVSPEGLKRLKKPQSLYWNLEKYFEYSKTGAPPYTPMVNIFPALHEALLMISHKELSNIIRQTSELAGAFRQAVIAGGLKIFPKNPSSALTVIELPENIFDKDVVHQLEKKAKFRIAAGQSTLKGKVIRIAHMGGVGFIDLQRLIIPLFETLRELGWKGKPVEVLDTFNEEYGLNRR